MKTKKTSRSEKKEQIGKGEEGRPQMEELQSI